MDRPRHTISTWDPGPGPRVLVLLLTLLSPVGFGAPVPARAQELSTPSLTTSPVCHPGEAPTPLTLRELWRAGEEREPGYQAVRDLRLAEDETRSALRREWAPVLSAQGLGTHGQRLSPGEERVLGVGPRGELRLAGGWTILDLERHRRARVIRLRQEEATQGERAFDAGYRAALAEAYARAVAAEELWEVRRRHARTLAELEALLRERLEAGVEPRWEVHLLDEAVARGERLLADADQIRAAHREDLSAVAGRCVRSRDLDLSLHEVPEAAQRPEAEDVTLLLRQAEVREAMAAEEAARGRIRLELVGLVGPNYSRAFQDDRIRQEYLVGVSLAWNPDLAGVRGRLAAAESARARATRARAESLRRSHERELAMLQTTLEHGDARWTGLVQEREQARRREEVALLRWQEGVDRWTEVLQARDRILEVATLEIELKVEVALAMIRAAEITGTLDDVPARLGQEEIR